MQLFNYYVFKFWTDEEKANSVCKELGCGESHYISKSDIFQGQPSSRSGLLQCVKGKDNTKFLWQCMKWPYNDTCSEYTSVICTSKCALLYYYSLNVFWGSSGESHLQRNVCVSPQNTGDFDCRMAPIFAPGRCKSTMSLQDRGFPFSM